MARAKTKTTKGKTPAKKLTAKSRGDVSRTKAKRKPNAKPKPKKTKPVEIVSNITTAPASPPIPKSSEIVLTPAAIDEASVACRNLFADTRGNFEGIHSWLLRMCGIAIAKFEKGDNALIKSITIYEGVRMRFRFRYRVESKTGQDAHAIWTLEWVAPVDHPGVWWAAETKAASDRAASVNARRYRSYGAW